MRCPRIQMLVLPNSENSTDISINSPTIMSPYDLSEPASSQQFSSPSSPPRTPNRPILNRDQTNASASSGYSTPSTIFDRARTPLTPGTPLSPFSSPSADSSRPGIEGLPFREKKCTFVHESGKSNPQVRNRRTSNPAQKAPPSQKRPPTRTSDTALAATVLQKASLSEHAPNLPFPPPSQGSSPFSSSTRPQLHREGDTPEISQRESVRNTKIEQTLGTTVRAVQILQEKRAKGVPRPVAAHKLGSSSGSDSEQGQDEGDNLDAETETVPPTDENDRKRSGPAPLKFTQYGEHKQAHTRNHEICEYILGKRNKNPNPNVTCDLGYVYVFASPAHGPGHVKIGLTKVHPAVRMKQIEKECKVKLGLVEDEHPDAFLHYKYLETIVHLALHSERKKYTCTQCKRKPSAHDEWFELPREKALKQVKLWRDWILIQTPFNKDGTLSDYWHWRAKKLPASFSTVNWEEWTQPAGWNQLLDYLDFLIEEWQRDYWIGFKKHMGRKDARFWQTGTILSLLVCLRFGSLGMFCAVMALFLL